LPFNYTEWEIPDLLTEFQILKIFSCMGLVCVRKGTETDMEERGRSCIQFLKDPTSVLGIYECNVIT